MSANPVGPTHRVRLVEVGSASTVEREDEVATEEPLEIRVVPSGSSASDPSPIAVTMRTPGNDFELAAGFLLSEGLLRVREEIREIAYCTEPGEPQMFNIVHVHLANGVPFDAERFRRHVYTTSSCGVCGKAALELVRTTVARPPLGRFRIDAKTLDGLPDRLLASQRVFDRTGGLHASALFTPDGDLLVVREDVGRHNALDKLIGHRLLEGSLPDSGTVLLVSGRACFELVQKAAVAGIPFLASVGAPTSLAIDLARDHGMTLVGFLRSGRFNLYAGPERIAL